MDDDIRPLNVNQYNSDEGKLIASIKWLITRIYEDNGIPDKLRELFYRDDEGNLNLTNAVAAALTNGSLYSQAASRILRDPGLVNQSHGTVLRALSRSVEIEVRDSDGALVTEMALISTDPLRLTTHLALIDALMTAHMKSIITIDNVVTAVSEYTMVEKREEPMDCIDSLLFWINKICLLVRDDVERNDILLKGGTENITIPEMEDLYEDLCDGTCITALISFYRPHEIQLSDICFNDPISLQDCRYNLGLLKNFCEICLPWNPFHFEIDDILYLHESLQPNVNAFLADLFYFFEPSQSESEQQMQQQQLQSPTQRRFIPINAIPELRAQNLANRPMHPPKVRNHHLAVDRNRTLSLSSQDSLMTSKSGERQNNSYRPTTLPPGAPTMSFGALGGGNGSELSSPNNGFNNGSENNGADQNNKSDSTNLTAIRLALHQRRQEYEQKQYMEKLVICLKL
uniref:Calponin-homology (CH) domain-containing protein n=1 Tax=Panagrolaimus sp. ES5 TaxID=591445 RepID=A0AC34GPK5_9BILA